MDVVKFSMRNAAHFRRPPRPCRLRELATGPTRKPLGEGPLADEGRIQTWVDERLSGFFVSLAGVSASGYLAREVTAMMRTASTTRMTTGMMPKAVSG